MTGSGCRSEPYRYYPGHKPAEWKDDPLYQFTEMMRANDQRVARLVRGEKEQDSAVPPSGRGEKK